MQTTLTLYAEKSIHEQLKAARVAKGICLKRMAERLNLAPSNVHHFENKNKSNGVSAFASSKNGLTEQGIKYAKALGYTKIEILL